MNSLAESKRWPPDLHQCPICSGLAIDASLEISRGESSTVRWLTCTACSFRVESSGGPEALRLTLEMFAEGGKALAELDSARSGNPGAAVTAP